ncbi:MAG TPA: hypothetical protein VL326_21580 [Kofleriaceae bacterium]|jgi:hypothetical protein|nr:hypothetical protein [Kofleriaceae bacterium]
MRFALLVAVVVLLVSNVAHADRSAVLTLGGAFGGASTVSSSTYYDGSMSDPYYAPDDTMSGPQGAIGAARASLAWEKPLPEFLDDRKSNFSGSFVPELNIGSLFESDRAEGFLGLGLRAELRAAHNRIAPFNLTYKVGGYFVGRALVLGKSQDAVYEFGIGEWFARFKGFSRAGFELTIMARPHYMDTDDTQILGLFSLYAGWAP